MMPLITGAANDAMDAIVPSLMAALSMSVGWVELEVEFETAVTAGAEAAAVVETGAAKAGPAVARITRAATAEERILTVKSVE